MSHLEVKIEGDVAVATLINPLISSDDQIHEIAKELKEVFDTTPGKKVLLSFSNVKSMPSLMIGELIMLQRKIKEQDAKLRLCSLRKPMLESLQITGIYELFDIDENEKSGIEGFTA